MLHEWLLFIHIVSVVVYVGGAVAVTVQATGAAGMPHQFLALSEVAGRAVGIGAVFTLLSGIALVLESEVWGFSMFFVLFGIFALVISGAVEGLYTRRRTAAIEAAVEEEGADAPKIGASLRQVTSVNAIVIVLLVTVIGTMVFKTGA